MEDEVVARTRAWVEKAVIGLNLCPFAKPVHLRGAIRYAVSPAETEEELLADLERELHFLRAAEPAEVETTLIVHPGVLADFLDYNDFLGVAESAVAEWGFEGEIQVASFHPHYQFAGTRPDDLGNATNRSPYPTLHLLREASVEKAVAAFPDPAEIYEENIRTLNALGRAGWKRLDVGPPRRQS